MFIHPRDSRLHHWNVIIILSNILYVTIILIIYLAIFKKIQKCSLFNYESFTSWWWSLTAIVLFGMSGVPFERPLDFRRDGWCRRDMGALHLEAILVRYPRDTDLLAIRRYIRILALRDDRRLVVHLFRLARFLMTDPVARLETNDDEN